MWIASNDTKQMTLSRIFTTVVAFKACMLLLESQHKTRYINWNSKDHSPEETTGIFGLAAFTWLNQLFSIGYKRAMTLRDLFPLDQSMATEIPQQRLMAASQSPRLRGQKLGLARGLAKTLAASLLLPIFPRLCLSAFKFCQPFLIFSLLNLLKEPASLESSRKGYGLIGATVLIYIGIAVSTAFYWYFHERTLCIARGVLAGAIYKKTTEVRLSDAGDTAALTLMGVDIERIRLGFLNLHEFWANTIEVAIASWLLYRQVGAAFLATLVIVLCCLAGAAFFNRFTGRRQKEWMRKTQDRVGLTANAVSNMKHLKISGLAEPVEDMIQNMRVEELKIASRFRTIYVIVVTLGYAPLALSPVMTFAVTARTLDVATIFTSMSFLLLLGDPLSYIFQNIPNLLAAFASLDRIQTFMENESRVDYRLEERNTSLQSLGQESSYSEETSDSEYAVKIVYGNFGWTTETITLRDINLTVPQRGLTVIVGPVASGKSTLCKVLLGEVPVHQGLVIINPNIISCRVGYCDQIPRLSNDSIRQNIIGFAPYNRRRYQEVIEATMLELDLAVLPMGEDTMVGSNGITLSGGQRQRVSIARALYLETNFFLFDDILSGLDAETEAQLFRRVFGPRGLMRRRRATALLCTHNMHHLPSADHIAVLSADGRIAEQGRFHDLATSADHANNYRLSMASRHSSVAEITLSDTQWSHEPEQEATPTPMQIGASFIDAKSRRTGISSVHRYYLGSLGKRSLLTFIVFGLGWGFFYNWGTVWLDFWSEDVGNGPPSRSNGYYIGLYSVFQVCYLSSMFFIYFICFRTMIQISGSKLHKAALGTVIRAPLSFFAATDTGLITNLFSQDMNLIDTELPIAVTNLALDICNAIGMAAVIATASPFLAITYPFIFIILFFLQKLYLRTSRQLRLLDLEAKTPL
jgi:ATP-binding cassette subfamily C (CFTR/MRP) protein 1